MAVIGVDPGLGGALAYYDKRAGFMHIEDMPVWNMQVGKKLRKRIDAVKLITVLDLFLGYGADLLVIEAVGGRPNQSAGGAFVFGYSVGLVYMASIMLRIPVDTVPSQSWKRVMKIPGKQADEANKEIVRRADELLPAYREQWRGPQGGLKIDRAEAAMLAKFGEDHILPSADPARIRDTEWRLAYREADTGA